MVPKRHSSDNGEDGLGTHLQGDRETGAAGNKESFKRRGRMNFLTNYQREVLDDVCRLIFKEFSDTVGIAFLQLDCDCIKLAGVSFTAEQTSPMMLVSANPPIHDEETNEELIAVCEKCAEDSLGIFRVKNRGMIWNDGNVKLTEQAKNKIRRKVFDSKFEKLR
jgi:hypothetical protein